MAKHNTVGFGVELFTRGNNNRALPLPFPSSKSYTNSDSLTPTQLRGAEDDPQGWQKGEEPALGPDLHPPLPRAAAER